MANLNGYAKRVATLREAMEATMEKWGDKLSEMEGNDKAETKAYSNLEEKISKLEDAISTLENLEMELEEPVL